MLAQVLETRGKKPLSWIQVGLNLKGMGPRTWSVLISKQMGL
jgi:hypothetical protein